MMKLTGRTILITGGSAGVDLAFARKFLELGNEVIVTCRRQAVLDEVKARYPMLHTIQSDVADPTQLAATAAHVQADSPKLDRLMNNRLAPDLINRQLWKASKALVPAVAAKGNRLIGEIRS